MISRHDAVMGRAVDTLYKITAFERPKMRAKEAPPDKVPHDRVPPDLTKLTRAELDALEKMVLKVSGGSTTDVFAGPPANPGERRAPQR
jgi:hypothetical protein